MRPGSTGRSSMGWTAWGPPAFDRIVGTLLRRHAATCTATHIVARKLRGSLATSWVRASIPPADAPITTMSRDEAVIKSELATASVIKKGQRLCRARFGDKCAFAGGDAAKRWMMMREPLAQPGVKRLIDGGKL